MNNYKDSVEFVTRHNSVTVYHSHVKYVNKKMPRRGQLLGYIVLMTKKLEAHFVYKSGLFKLFLKRFFSSAFVKPFRTRLSESCVFSFWCIRTIQLLIGW